MTPGQVLMVRHGRTAWNLERRIQGHTDVALCDAGREELAGRRLPAAFSGCPCHASPLVRAVETARRLGAAEPLTDPRLAEMRWGEWEGRRVADLRAELGDEMARNEARGLDFRPPGGESPRDVQARLREWLCEHAASGDRVVVTHKGVIRAALCLATGWDMLGRPPLRLDWSCGHLFGWDPEAGRLSLPGPNLDLGA